MGVPANLGRCGFSAVKKQPALSDWIFPLMCRLLFSDVQQIHPLSHWERVRVRASSGGTNFCSERRRVLPSLTGRGSGFAVASRGLPALEYGGGAGCFLRWAAAPSVGMAAQRHETMRIRKFIVLKKQMKKQPALRFPQCRLLFCGRSGLCRHRHHLQRIRAAAFAHVRAAGDDVLVAHF